eukprot:CAMPEP_0117443284 /NCGR_PEP_ID=MMETSP0759-20121206/4612_1 /TAXON_ID=63605 /ORGANISM="Percolomonas cosmopolitus, Strain WS" /LENGTH=221 /DNA_ID=CAMNT_0005235247 /DNA_START=97 /DNA_END=762 /DNA_ORIENTATION=-
MPPVNTFRLTGALALTIASVCHLLAWLLSAFTSTMLYGKWVFVFSAVFYVVTGLLLSTDLDNILNVLTFILFGVGGFIYLIAAVSFFFASPSFALIGYILNLCGNVAFLVGSVFFLMKAIGSSINELYKKLKSQLADYQQMSVPAVIGTLWSFGALLQVIGNAVSIVKFMYIPWLVTSNIGIAFFISGCVIFVWMELSKEKADTSGAAKYQRLMQEEEAIL